MLETFFQIFAALLLIGTGGIYGWFGYSASKEATKNCGGFCGLVCVCCSVVAIVAVVSGCTILKSVFF